MRLYLVRHGKAGHGPVDAERHLSDRGRLDVEAMARYLADQHVTAQRVVHSGLVRARQTAEGLAAKVAPGKDVEFMPGIEPWGSIDNFAKAVQGWNEDTMACGHEPFMGEAAAKLLGNRNLMGVETCTVMAFERTEAGETWNLLWVLNPRTIGRSA